MTEPVSFFTFDTHFGHAHVIEGADRDQLAP